MRKIFWHNSLLLNNYVAIFYRYYTKLYTLGLLIEVNLASSVVSKKSFIAMTIETIYDYENNILLKITL